MLSKVKKSLVTGLSVVLSASLSCGTCACAYSNEDYKQMIQEHATCFAKKDRCSWKCLNAKGGITDTLPDFCGGDTINSLRQSFFPGCEAEYLDCNQKALGNLSLTEKLKSWWNLRGKSSDEIGVPKEDFDKFLRLLSNALIDGPMDNMVSYYKKTFGSNDGKLFWLNMKVGSMIGDYIFALLMSLVLSAAWVVVNAPLIPFWLTGMVLLGGRRNPMFRIAA